MEDDTGIQVFIFLALVLVGGVSLFFCLIGCCLGCCIGIADRITGNKGQSSVVVLNSDRGGSGRGCSGIGGVGGRGITSTDSNVKYELA